MTTPTTVIDEVRVADPRGVVLQKVEGIPIGNHLLVHRWDGTWHLTHRPTGRLISTYRDGPEAVRQAQILVESGAELGDAYDSQAVEEIRGIADHIRWQQAEEAVHDQAGT